MRAAPRQYGLIVLDAFSSDAIPMHLLTKEALELYFSRLDEHGNPWRFTSRIAISHLVRFWRDSATSFNSSPSNSSKECNGRDKNRKGFFGLVFVARSSDDLGPLDCGSALGQATAVSVHPL